MKTLNGKSDKELGTRYDGLNIRADGGYAVAFGRNHRGPYVWLRDADPHTLESLPLDLQEFSGTAASASSAENTGPGNSAPGPADVVADRGEHAPHPQARDTVYHSRRDLPALAAPRVQMQLLLEMALENAAGGSGRNNAESWLVCQCRDNGTRMMLRLPLAAVCSSRAMDPFTLAYLAGHGDMSITKGYVEGCG